MQTETVTAQPAARPFDESAAILHAIGALIRSRPGMDPCNYTPKGWRADARRVQRDRRDALELLHAVEYAKPNADELKAALRGAFSGRLSWDSERRALSYCAGQHYPTEYRAACCAVLAAVLWDRERDNMPAPSAWRAEGMKSWNGSRFSGPVGPWRDSEAAARADLATMPDSGGGYRGSVDEGYGSRKVSAGDWLRAKFRDRFGRSIAARWFA